jgi:ABC-type lipoprotein release transport system permease subunit
MKSSAYSGTPLAKKLGLKDGDKIRLINQPGHYLDLFDFLPEVEEVKSKKIKKNVIHIFVKELKELEKCIGHLRNEIEPNGMIWVSWIKKNAKIATDVTEDKVRNLALKNGLVDVKVCAIDETWSGLKLVIRLKDRTK